MTVSNIVLVALAAVVYPAEAKESIPQVDQAALTELLEATVRSINEEDWETNKKLFAKNGDHINPMGRASRGRDEIATMMQDAKSEFGPWKSKCRASDRRLLKPQVALEVREWSMVESTKKLNLTEPSPELLVHVKRAGKWKILAARPLIPFKPDGQAMPGEVPTAAGFSDPKFAEELKTWKDKGLVAEHAIVLGGYGNIYRGQDEVQKFLQVLREGRQSLTTTVNSARRIGKDIMILDNGYEAEGKWHLPKRGTIEGTVRGMWFGVYSRQGEEWVLEAARVMIPYLPE